MEALKSRVIELETIISEFMSSTQAELDAERQSNVQLAAENVTLRIKIAQLTGPRESRIRDSRPSHRGKAQGISASSLSAVLDTSSSGHSFPFGWTGDSSPLQTLGTIPGDGGHLAASERSLSSRALFSAVANSSMDTTVTRRVSCADLTPTVGKEFTAKGALQTMSHAAAGGGTDAESWGELAEDIELFRLEGCPVSADIGTSAEVECALDQPTAPTPIAMEHAAASAATVTSTCVTVDQNLLTDLLFLSDEGTAQPLVVSTDAPTSPPTAHGASPSATSSLSCEVMAAPQTTAEIVAPGSFAQNPQAPPGIIAASPFFEHGTQAAASAPAVSATGSATWPSLRLLPSFENVTERQSSSVSPGRVRSLARLPAASSRRTVAAAQATRSLIVPPDNVSPLQQATQGASVSSSVRSPLDREAQNLGARAIASERTVGIKSNDTADDGSTAVDASSAGERQNMPPRASGIRVEGARARNRETPLGGDGGGEMGRRGVGNGAGGNLQHGRSVCVTNDQRRGKRVAGSKKASSAGGLQIKAKGLKRFGL